MAETKTKILTAGAIEDYKAHTDRTIAYARYRIGNTFYKVPIHRRERLKDGRVAVYFSITPQIGQDVTVAQVQLFDLNNELWADKTENITIRGVQEGVLYRFTFDFKEV